MSFEFSKLKLPSVELEFKPYDGIPDGEGVKIAVNPNFLSSERIDKINELLEARAKELFAAPVETYEADPEAASEAVEIDGDGKAEKGSKKRRKLLKSSGGAEEKPITTATATAEPAAAETRIVKGANLSDVYAMEREQIRFRAQILGGIEGDDDPGNRLIASWDVIADGTPVPVCFGSFARMPLNMLNALYEFCSSEAARPSKKTKKPSGSI